MLMPFDPQLTRENRDKYYKVREIERKISQHAMSHVLTWVLLLALSGPVGLCVLSLLVSMGMSFDLRPLDEPTNWSDVVGGVLLTLTCGIIGTLYFRWRHRKLLAELRQARHDYESA